MEVPADEIDDKSKKNSFYALTFNPNYSPDILIDEFILCLPESSEAFKLELELTNKYGCTGTIKDKVLCDVEIRKRSTNANYPFNPNYSPEQIIDEYILCLQKNSEALQLQIKLSNKYGCSGSLKDKILCGIRNRDNFDVSDYDLLLKIYNLLPECAKKLSSDKSTLTGHSFIKNAYDSLDIEIRKRSSHVVIFNPNYSPDEIMDKYILCLDENPEGLILQLGLSSKYGCTGSLTDKILCAIHNRDSFDSNDYDLFLKLYKMLRECVGEFILDDGGLTGYALAENFYHSLGHLYNV
ncbi:hypothetical protein FQR65_LT04387 [Abscondita terminalis]|nr:hypothetical protein FQR65_LT04387 [Abscondita terminalis]